MYWTIVHNTNSAKIIIKAVCILFLNPELMAPLYVKSLRPTTSSPYYSESLP